ncbi:cyclophilin-like protein [Neoconidiobolus thromboides FSU 785]|nr:cyclophilin-like protein [Neoconidiobolus thromboides FSU 785]
MGKWTDKLYITHSEWANEYGGSSFGGLKKKKQEIGFKRLPFYCCAISLQPFETPYATPEGHVFDLENIVPYLKEFGTNPITGNKLEAKDLFPLEFHKNNEGKYCCPVTYKIFTDHTHIVANKVSGQVYAYETIEKLNFKEKLFKDLVTDQDFKKADIITLQDPHNVENRNLNNFKHIKNALKVPIKDNSSSINLSSSAKRILADANKTTEPLKKKMMQSEIELKEKEKTDMTSKSDNATRHSQGRVAASFTSMGMTPVTVNETAYLSNEQLMFQKIKSKGYCSITTNYGDINLELHCDITPKTCYNFIMLAKKGYYDGVSFHRLISNFMIQGGDPSGTGKGGESYWKEDFEDELKNKLSHDSRGILAMANKGKNTNNSQFYITFRACSHLDGKHTIFGKVVGGKPVLDALERIETDQKDKPRHKITIEKIKVFVNPFDEHQKNEQEREKMEQERQQIVQKKKEDDSTTVFGTKLTGSKSIKESTKHIGKYLNKESITAQIKQENKNNTKATMTSTKKSGNYGNFDKF